MSTIHFMQSSLLLLLKVLFCLCIDVLSMCFLILVFGRALFCAFRFFFLMIRRPPRSTLDRSSAASDVYKRQDPNNAYHRLLLPNGTKGDELPELTLLDFFSIYAPSNDDNEPTSYALFAAPVSYTHLRAHETVLDIVCRLLLEKKTT